MENFYDFFSPVQGPYRLNPFQSSFLKRNRSQKIRLPKRKYRYKSKTNFPKTNFQMYSHSESIVNNNGNKQYKIEKLLRKNNKGKYFKNINGRKTIKNLNFNSPIRTKSVNLFQPRFNPYLM